MQQENPQDIIKAKKYNSSPCPEGVSEALLTEFKDLNNLSNFCTGEVSHWSNNLRQIVC